MAILTDELGIDTNSFLYSVDGVSVGAATTQPPVASMAEAFGQEPLWLEWPSPPTGATIINPKASPVGYLRVQAFLRSTPGLTWDVGYWDAEYWTGAGEWVDIDRFRGLDWTRGCESPLDRPRVGTATVTLDNRDGEISPWNPTGSLAWIQPGTLIRWGAHFAAPAATVATGGVDDAIDTDTTLYTVDGTPLNPDLFEQEWLPFFTGRIESMKESTEQEADGWVELTVNEMTADLGAFNGAEQGLLGTGDTLEARIARLLDDADWQAGHTVDPDAIGDLVTYQPTAMASNRLSELYLTGDSVGMRVLAGSNGSLRVTAPYPDSSVQETTVFSNKPGAFGALPIVSVTPYASNDRLVNVAVAARAGGSEHTVMDRASISEHGRVDPGGSRGDLIAEDDDVIIAMLQREVDSSKEDTQGIESIQLDTDQDPVNLPHVVGRYASKALEDRIPFSLIWYHPSGNVFSEALVINGMKHSITPIEPGVAMKWTCTLSTAARIVTTSMTWNVDYWDATHWAYTP